MKTSFIKSLFLIALAFNVFSMQAVELCPKVTKAAHKGMVFASKQYSLMAGELKNQEGRLPKTTDKDGKLITSDAKWWCSGFFPGTLWYLYEYNQDLALRNEAIDFSKRIEGEKYTLDNHDIGFIIQCSYGNANRLEPSQEYQDIILTAAESLSTRFKPNVGLIRSWDWGTWNYPVIIDNMMNLELLFNATRMSGDRSYFNIAVDHADKTLENHFREDGSSYHVVDYDSVGQALWKGTWQGYSDASSWARGQAWAIYGYTVCYRETGNIKYLQHAEKIANFILDHPRLPKDKIPYWDFDAPNIPNALRDASAGAVICSALIELSTFVRGEASEKYLEAAEKQILALTSKKYRANLGENGNFILKHSVGFLPKNSEVDVPLTYADYYYVEALQRYLKLGNKK